MDKGGKEGGEEGDAKRLSTDQPKVPQEQENKAKKSSQSKPVETKSPALEREYASDVSISSEVIRNEFKEMYGESEEEEIDEMEEEGEEEEEEEEGIEEQDLSEFKLKLEEKYMKGVEFSEEYLKKENKKIEDVPLQIYAIETYINSVRTFYGYANHWIRLKVFDSPCFEIRPCNKTTAHASMYPNMSINQSKGSINLNEMKNYSKMELVETEIMSQRRKEMQNKRLDYDLSNMNEREKRTTIARLMREEVTKSGIDYFTRSTLKIQSKEKEVGLDIPLVELLEDEEVEGFPLEERRGSKVWILREPLESGKTIMFPMRPAQFIYQLQRQPLKLFVLSTSGMMSSGKLELSGLTEAVIRASKGPPYPISSMQRFKTITTGDFTAKVVGSVRVIAIGPQNVSTIKCEGNPNDTAERSIPRRSKVPTIVYNMDSHEEKPSILTGPQKFTLCDIVKNIRARKLREKHQPPPEPAPKRYYVEDLVFNRANKTVTRAPKKTYVALRAEIDRYLVLNRSHKERPRRTTAEEESIGSTVDSEERSTFGEEVGEELDMEIEEEERLEGEEAAQRVEAVFQSLIKVYGQNGPDSSLRTNDEPQAPPQAPPQVPPQAPPSSSATVVDRRNPMKPDRSKKSLSATPIWKRFQSSKLRDGKH